MTVLVLTGLARAGKDTIADYLAQKHGFARLTFSSVLEELLRKKGIPPTKQSMIELGDSLRKELGMDAVAKLLDKKITRDDRLVLAGPRSIEEVQYFRKKYPELKLVKVTAEPENRVNRRSRIDPKEKEAFFERDDADLRNKGLQKVLDAAEFELKNDDNRQELYKRIDELVKQIGI